MTGGPDGDLGSNEILMGNEIILGVVDGSGVLQDPAGLDKTELNRLAKLRIMCINYQHLLSDKGYKIDVKAKNFTLPDGEVIISGENFRNKFILRDDITADLLVPCGGRPETIDPYNYTKLFKANGTPRFKYIVEGANLFVTESVRSKLQERGIILFKDASTNKGGVTSSSMEVLAALSVDEEFFIKNFRVKNDGTVPELQDLYVQEIIKRVEENARLEFELVWAEMKKNGS